MGTLTLKYPTTRRQLNGRTRRNYEDMSATNAHRALQNCCSDLASYNRQYSLRRRAIGGQDLAGEVQRAGDEDARRRGKFEPRGHRKRTFDIVAGERGNAGILGDFRQGGRGQRLLLMN